MCQQSAAFQQELWALQRGFSNSTASRPINNGAKSELDDLKIWAMQSGVTERVIGTREWRGRREFPKGALKIGQELCMPAHSFSSITPLTYTYIAARVADLDSLAQHYHHSLLPPPLFATNLSRCRSSWFQQNQEAVNWTSRSPLERTQCRQARVGSTSYHCSTRGDCSTNWNGYLIDAGKPIGSTFQ